MMTSGGMTAAGALLCISQPAVTRLIRDLEAELELKLFVRNNTQLNPTKEAEALFREVERYFSGGERIRAAARALREAKAGYLHVGAMPNVNSGMLPRAVSAFLKTFPDVVVSVRTDPSTSLVEMLLHSQIDVAYARRPPDRQALLFDALPSIPAVCVMPKGHRFERKAQVDVADLDGEDLVSLGINSAQRLRLNQVMLAAGVHPRIRMETMHSSTAAAYVAEGVGVAIIDLLAAGAERREDIVFRPFTPRIETEFGAIYRGPPSTAALALTRALRDAVTVELRNMKAASRYSRRREQSS